MVRNLAYLLLAVTLGWMSTSVLNAQPCQSATLTATISPADTAYVCEGADLQLSGNAIGIPPPVYAWEWSTGETDKDITVDSPGDYYLVVFDSSGCTDTARVNVIYLSRPTVNIGEETIVCNGSTFVIDGGPFETWSWSTGETTSSISVTVTRNTTIALIVTNSFACADSDTVTFRRYPVPSVNIGRDTAVCNGSSIVLDAGPGFTNYLWNEGTADQILIADSTGSYVVVVTDTNGCQTPSNVVDLVVNLPVIPIITENNNVLTSTETVSYQWYQNGTPITDATLRDYTPDEDGTYTVEIIDENGCTATSDPYNFVLFREITQEMISEGISPNGDGVLDAWLIPYIEFYPQNELVIFNRWGNSVFTREGYSNADPFVGQSDKGNELTDGVYYYILNLGGDFGEFQGKVVINR